MKETEILLVYDGECPFCHSYSRLLRLRDSVGGLILINAREENPVVNEIKERGYDLNQGMVVKMSDRFYHGSDAIHILALLSSRSGFFNKLNYWCFKSKKLSIVLYPILRSRRYLVLKLIGRSKIEEAE